MVAPEPMAVAVEPVAVQPVALPASAVDDRPRGRAAGAVGLVAFVTVLGIGVAGLFGGALLLLDVALRQAAK